MCTELYGQMRSLVLPCRLKSHSLCSLFKRHCKQGCWVGCTASSLLWLAFWLGKLNAVYSNGRATNQFPDQVEQENHLQGWQGSLCSCLKSTHSPSSLAKQATGFALQPIISACHTLYLSVAELCSFQVFWPGGPGGTVTN